MRVGWRGGEPGGQAGAAIDARRSSARGVAACMLGRGIEVRGQGDGAVLGHAGSRGDSAVVDGTDFSTVIEAELDAVADELNDRPRKRLAFANTTEQLAELLLQ